MSKQVRLGVVMAVLALLGVLLYSTMQQAAYKVEVCVSYKGRSHCATAAAETREAAVAAGQQVGCALITSGRDENMACLAQAPSSTKDAK
jgi:hypothetical protein